MTMNSDIGSYRKQAQGYTAFVPLKFPPKKGFRFSKSVLTKSSKATLLLGRLDGITHLLPDADFFLFMYVRKDASSSSQIEGTQATMIQALEAESKTSNRFPEDVSDILQYIMALNHGLEYLSDIPLSLRAIQEIHKVLMSGGRMSHYSDPGHFRKSQNWIGGTSPNTAMYVPPPTDEMENALHDLEKFFHADDEISPIIKAAIIHAQFETIHPFLDGNGRTGRLLITLFLEVQKILEKPVLFISTYFKKHQQVYYQKLNDYREGQIDGWVEFFLDGVIETAEEAIDMAKQINALREEDLTKLQTLGKTAATSAVEILPKLFQSPIVNVARISEWTGFTRQGAQKVIDRFVDLGILEIKNDNKSYGRSYSYSRYIKIFYQH